MNYSVVVANTGGRFNWAGQYKIGMDNIITRQTVLIRARCYKHSQL